MHKNDDAAWYRPAPTTFGMHALTRDAISVKKQESKDSFRFLVPNQRCRGAPKHKE